MKRKALVVIAAAAAVAAIVVLTTGAFAGTSGTSGRPDQPSDRFAAFISCLASHGVQVPSDDPVKVKQWLADRQSDPAVQAALQACGAADDTQGDGTEPGPTPAELVACLEQHGVDVPSDVKQNPDTLKQWLIGAMEQPGVKAALMECADGSARNAKKK
jgi:hypothetical protein